MCTHGAHWRPRRAIQENSSDRYQGIHQVPPLTAKEDA